MFERKPGLRLSNSKLIWRNYSKVALKVGSKYFGNSLEKQHILIFLIQTFSNDYPEYTYGFSICVNWHLSIKKIPEYIFQPKQLHKNDVVCS